MQELHSNEIKFPILGKKSEKFAKLSNNNDNFTINKNQKNLTKLCKRSKFSNNA